MDSFGFIQNVFYKSKYAVFTTKLVHIMDLLQIIAVSMKKRIVRRENTVYRILMTRLSMINATTLLTEQVYERLKDAITEGTLFPGQRLLQAELADDLGVSRAPVSYALHLLKHQGLVRESGRRGVEIIPIDLDKLRNVYQVRAALDGLAARLLASRFAAGDQPPDARARIDAALALGKAFPPDTPLKLRVRADLAFHQEIHAACGNPTISEALVPLWPHVGRAMNTVLSATDNRVRAWTEHTEIAALIFAGDPEGSARAAWDHATKAGLEAEERLRPRLTA